MQQKYIEQMEEIRRRIESIEIMTEVENTRLYLPVVTENVYLQIRKILELIAMASLVANKEVMEEFSRSLQGLGHQWNGYKILKQVEKINPDFYPVPIIEKPHNNPHVKSNLDEMTTGFLTRDMFSELYNRRCAPLLHADNPYGRKKDYKKLWDEGAIWKRRIMKLLNTHMIKLVGHEGFYLVHMQGVADGKVHMYQFEPI